MKRAGCVVLAVVFGACGGAQRTWQPEGLGRDSSLLRYRWPPPPEEPRVALVGQFQPGVAVGRRQGFAARLVDIVAGAEGGTRRERAAAAARPAGVAIGADSTLLITDARLGTATLLRPGQPPLMLRPPRGSLVAPLGVAAARDGVFYVSDAGAGLVYRYPGRGSALESFATGVEWGRPVGVAVDTVRSRIIVVDAGEHVARVLGFDGAPQFTIGRRGAGRGEFNYPTFAAVAPDGAIVVVDAMNFRIQVFTPDGEFVRAFGSAGDATGYFAAPKGICVDPDGHVVIVDTRFAAVHLYDLQGHLLLALGRYGAEPDAFALPTGVACDQAGRFFVADTWNGRISVFRVWSPAEERR